MCVLSAARARWNAAVQSLGGMASGKWGTGGTCTMRLLYPTSSSLLPAPKHPSAIILTRGSSPSCSNFLLLPSLEITICCRRKRRRWINKSPGPIFCMQRKQDGEMELSEMELQRSALPSDATSSTSFKDTAQTSEVELQCIGTGLDVECVVSEADSFRDSKGSASPATNGTTSGRSNKMPFSFNQEQVPEMDCFGTGTDVECVIPGTNGGLNSSKKIALRASTFVKTQADSIDSSVNSSSETPLLVNDDGEQQWQQQFSSLSLLRDSWEYLVLISPFFFWGTAMVAMKGILPKAGPLFVAAIRLIPSGFLLIAFAKFQGRKQPSGLSAWLAIALFALVDASCFQGFLAEGLKRTSAGLGSVIIDSQPLTVAVLASILFGETIGSLGVLGLATGVIGLLLLEVPTQVIEDVLKGQGLTVVGEPSVISTSLNNWSIWDSGEWWMLLAAQSMAVGTVMVRWLCQFADPVMATGWHMVLGGIPLLALAGIQHDPALSGHIQDLELADWSALLYTSIFGSAVSYGVFFYNASRGSLTKLSSLTFLTPMFAALFGFILLHETLNATQIVGACVTLASIYLINTKTSSKDKDDIV